MKTKATASVIAYGCPNCKYIMSRWSEDWYDMEEEFMQNGTPIICSNCRDARVLKEWIPIKKNNNDDALEEDAANNKS